MKLGINYREAGGGLKGGLAELGQLGVLLAGTG